MKPEDYAKIQEKYGGKFAAMREDQVIESADTHGELVQKLKEKGLDSKDLVFEFIRRKDRIYIWQRKIVLETI